MGTTNSMPNAKFKIAFINIINKHVHVSWPRYWVITVFYSVYFMCFTEFDNLNIMKTFFPHIFVPCSYVSESGIRLCIVYSISFTHICSHHNLCYRLLIVWMPKRLGAVWRVVLPVWSHRAHVSWRWGRASGNWTLFCVPVIVYVRIYIGLSSLVYAKLKESGHFPDS